MAKAEKKVLGLLPRCLSTTLLLGLIAAVALALIWSWVMAQDTSQNNDWLMIVELLALAVLIGVAVGMVAADAKPVTLWVAAGLAIVGVILARVLVASSMAPLDTAVLGSLDVETLSTSVSIGAVILAIVGAASVSLGNKIKL